MTTHAFVSSIYRLRALVDAALINCCKEHKILPSNCPPSALHLLYEVYVHTQDGKTRSYPLLQLPYYLRFNKNYPLNLLTSARLLVKVVDDADRRKLNLVLTELGERQAALLSVAIDNLQLQTTEINLPVYAQDRMLHGGKTLRYLEKIPE